METKRRKVISSKGRRMIANVYHFLKKEYNFTLLHKEPNCDVSHLRNITQRTAEATGVCTKTVLRILKEEKELPSTTSAFPSPMQKRRKREEKTKIDYCTADAVRSTIQKFHNVHKVFPTLVNIKSILNDRIGFDGCVETLRKLLLKLGYVWRKADNDRKVLMESHGIQMRRLKYLKEMSEYRSQGRPIIYTDECDIISSGRSSARFILVHAGSKDGFIQNASLICKVVNSTVNDHSNMSYDNYVKWLNENLLPNLPARSVIVLDNASHHNARVEQLPTSASTIEDMQKWLREKGVAFQESLLKSELYDIIIKHKDHHIIYKIDYFIKSKGFDVLRLPPNHPELNAIEHIWGTIKYNISLKNIENINVSNIGISESLNQITIETWLDACNHVESIEMEYLKHLDE